MRICLVNAEFLPSRGSGQAVYAERVAFGLAAAHDVTVLTSHPPGCAPEERMGALRVLRIPVSDLDVSKWLAFGLKVAGALRRLQGHERFDAVHFLDAHVGYRSDGRFTASLMQSFRQRLRGSGDLPYHSSLWNLLQRYPYYQLARRLERTATRKATRMMAISEATREEFVCHYGVDACTVDVVYPGIDTELFRPVDAGPLRKRLGLMDAKVLLYVGFSTPRKGLEFLAEAMGRLRDTSSRLVLVGRWEKGYRERFFQMLTVPRERVVEVGVVADRELPAYYSMADVFVLPSLLEGFGIPLAEALACRTPVVGTSAGSIPEVVGDCGLIVPPRDGPALAEAIERMLEDAALTADIKQRSRERVLRTFSLESMIEGVTRFLSVTEP